MVRDGRAEEPLRDFTQALIKAWAAETRPHTHTQRKHRAHKGKSIEDASVTEPNGDVKGRMGKICQHLVVGGGNAGGEYLLKSLWTFGNVDL